MSRSTGRRWTTALAGASVLALGALFIGVGPAQAATTVSAQLSLSGVATSDSPTGGSVVGIHPGDSVSISASTVPTAGLEKLGLGDLLGGALSSLAGFQVTADFSKLPGGADNTVLTSGQSTTFAFPSKGTYKFTWSAQRVSLLGVVPIDLDGNQLAAAGIKLNAQNQYVGEIVVATSPPKGGISVQLPGTSVQPQVGPVSLPKVSLPGVTTPTIPVSVPDLSTVTGKVKGATSSTTKTSGGTSSTSSGTSKGVLPVPAMVVPQGSGQVLGSTSNYQFTPVTGGSSSGGLLSYNNSTFGTPALVKSKAAAKKLNSAGKDSTVTLAASRPASTSGMPVILAIVAVIALVLVAGTYARLFLLHKEPAAKA